MPNDATGLTRSVLVDRYGQYLESAGQPVTVVGGTLIATGTLGLSAGEAHIGQVGGEAVVAAAAQFTRPSDTTAYAVGDLVANSVTAGSVVPLTFTVARVNGGTGMIRRATIRKSTAVITNATFRLHLWATTPATITNGDNGAFLISGRADYLGAIDIGVDQVFTDGAVGFGTPRVGSEITFDLSGVTTIRGLLEARQAYAPSSGETYDVSLDVLQN